MHPLQGNKKAAKLEGLQVLRGVAALLVVWCHLGFTPAQVSRTFLVSSDLGAIGVDIFFVISGFVIAMTAENIGNDWKTFLAQRFARIVPLYYLLSGYVLLLMLVSSHSTGMLNALSLGNLFNSFAFVPLLDLTRFSRPVSPNGWTLSFEMWFYLCFAGLIWFRGGKLAGKLLPVLMIAGVAVIFAFYHWTWFLPKFLFNPFALEFCAGCVLFQARNLIGRRAFWLLAVGALTSLYFAAQASSLSAFMEILDDRRLALQRAFIWGGFAICTVGMVIHFDLKRALGWPKSLLLMGDASYSIYLFSPVVMWTVGGILHRINRSMGHEYFVLTPISIAFIYIPGSVVGGILLWKYFEVPVTRATKTILLRWVQKKPDASLIPKASVVCPATTNPE
jgi:peptidoglycan/LPS O-acetylase OafA/YrhL